MGFPGSFRSRTIVAVLAAAMALGGCGYTTRPMYPAQIHTVYVPVVESRSFRRRFEFELTEAVIKEIEAKTPFKVVRRPDADSELTITIRSISKHVIFTNGEGDPRELEVRYVVDAAWSNLKDGKVIASVNVPSTPAGPVLPVITKTGDLVPELGQSFATASKEAIDKIADQVVEMMETPW